MTLFRLDYLVYDLGNCADDTPTETGLICRVFFVGHLTKILPSAELILSKEEVRRRHEDGNGGFVETHNERFI